MYVSKIKRLLTAAAGFVLLFSAGGASADYALNLHQGVTPISHDAYALHMFVFKICVSIAVVVFGAMFFSILKHRKSKGAVPAQFHESTTVEIIWTVVPFLILIAMAIPATKALVVAEKPGQPDLEIKVTGYQWKWGYEYLGEDVSFISTLSTPRAQINNKQPKGPNYLLEVDQPLVVPVHKRVRMLITASDVIHSWWVPDLGMKKDAIPGYVNEMWFNIEKEGTYRGQCAELCGKDHGFMPIVVIAKNEADYRKWLADQKVQKVAAAAGADREWSMDELKARGKKVFASNCAACHQASGVGVPGVFPAMKGSAVATGPKAAHMSTVMQGRPGTAMSAFAGQLNDIDLAAVITYERNAWGNNTGDLVQPSEIKAAR